MVGLFLTYHPGSFPHQFVETIATTLLRHLQQCCINTLTNISSNLNGPERFFGNRKSF